MIDKERLAQKCSTWNIVLRADRRHEKTLSEEYLHGPFP